MNNVNILFGKRDQATKMWRHYVIGVRASCRATQRHFPPERYIYITTLSSPKHISSWYDTYHNHGKTMRPRIVYSWLVLFQGSIFSTIGRGINSIIAAIAGLIMAIVNAITTVRCLLLECGLEHSSLKFFQVIVTIFNILCCGCCSGSGRRSSGRRMGRRTY